MEQISYVLGFLFNPYTTRVTMIRKTRPEWQKGKLNGIGGKIKHDESPMDAMVREFEEETGLKVPADRWTECGNMLDAWNSGERTFTVYIFYAQATSVAEFLQAEKETDEGQVSSYPLNVLTGYKEVMIPNIALILSMIEHHKMLFEIKPLTINLTIETRP